MKDAMPRLFADLVAKLEDMHAIAMEGRRADNALDMQRVLASHLRMDFIALDATLGRIKQTLGDDYE